VMSLRARKLAHPPAPEEIRAIEAHFRPAE
jgi:hypothetical protein